MGVVTIANIALIDTGFAIKPSPINTTPSGSQFARANGIDSGNEMLLKGITVSANISSNNDDTNIPSKTDSDGFLEGPVINKVSVSADVYTITGKFDRRVSADMDLLKELRLAVKSKGIKMFYYSSTSDGFRDMTDIWGETTTAFSNNGGFTSGTTPVIFVRVKSIIPKQLPTSKFINYTMILTETG